MEYALDLQVTVLFDLTDQKWLPSLCKECCRQVHEVL
jgi:hypothetical protein